MADPKLKLKNMKVLSVTEKGSYHSKKLDKEVKTFEVVLQGVEDQSKVITGEAGEPLPETVVKDGTVEDVWVYEDTYGDRVTTKLFFPKPKGAGGGKGGYRGASPEELSIKKFSETSKVVGVGYSYALEVCKESTEPITATTLADIGDEIADRMWAKTKGLLGK